MMGTSLPWCSLSTCGWMSGSATGLTPVKFLTRKTSCPVKYSLLMTTGCLSQFVWYTNSCRGSTPRVLCSIWSILTIKRAPSLPGCAGKPPSVFISSERRESFEISGVDSLFEDFGIQ
eukprot:Lithocolla_globosa_v1_NODE_5016_length_1318_cov_18.406968.p2 type:complete len:118 gc:universal NODE_5016_length_1318_cov_18.406968:450-97(-)